MRSDCFGCSARLRLGLPELRNRYDRGLQWVRGGPQVSTMCRFRDYCTLVPGPDSSRRGVHPQKSGMFRIISELSDPWSGRFWSPRTQSSTTTPPRSRKIREMVTSADPNPARRPTRPTAACRVQGAKTQMPCLRTTYSPPQRNRIVEENSMHSINWLPQHHSVEGGSRSMGNFPPKSERLGRSTLCPLSDFP